MVAAGRYFDEVVDHSRVIKEMHHEAKREMIRGLDIRKALVRAIVSIDSEAVVLMLGILRIYCISLRISLVNLFMLCFKLVTKVSLMPEIAQVKVPPRSR